MPLAACFPRTVECGTERGCARQKYDTFALVTAAVVGALFACTGCAPEQGQALPGGSGGRGGGTSSGSGGFGTGGLGIGTDTGGSGIVPATGGNTGSGGISATGGVGTGGVALGTGGNSGTGGTNAGGGGSAGTVGVAGRAGGTGGMATGGAAVGTGGAGANGFVHPGAFFTQAELNRIRANVASSTVPWSTAWNAIKTTDAGTGYQPSVAASITDKYALQSQGHAAYVLAMKWVASGDIAYATAAKRVLDAWVNTVASIDSPEATLRTGIGTAQMANAAEIIAHGFNGAAGWPPSQVTKARTWFSQVVWKTICAGNRQRSSNWGTSALSGCMSTAVFTDERAKYDYAVAAFKNGFTDGPDGCAGVTQYICEASGQPTEAGRDQGHAQGGVGHLVETAMVAWNQGLNLVTYTNNRVVAGMEYLAKYNLGNDDVPYNPNFADPCNVHPSWAIISPAGRGSYSPVYEMAERLFTLAGVAHPYTTMVVRSAGYRPEKTNTDHAGMGTLLIPAP